MKKYIALLITSLCLFAAHTSLCAEPGGVEIEYSKASAYINNHPIPCYSINDYCGVYVKDLKNYGFSIDFNSNQNTVDITRDYSITEITGIENVTLPYQAHGTFYASSSSSDIRVCIEGEPVKSYWVDGYMMIILDEIAKYGTYNWDNDKSALFVSIDGLPQAEYTPIPKAKRQYSRIKLAGWQIADKDYSVFPNAERNWGFQRLEHAEPILYDWEKYQLTKYNSFYIDPSRPHSLYFTFDEGYEAGYTSQILDILEKYNVPATFFVTGEYLDTSADLVRRMIDGGFSVGNHTSSHPNLARCSTKNIINEIELVSNRLKSDFDYDTYYLRPPEGAFSERVLAIAQDMGYNTILWSFAYKDYDTSYQLGADYAYDMMTKYMHDGAIYLIHAVSRDNANALERVILYALEHGYTFNSLDDLCQP